MIVNVWTMGESRGIMTAYHSDGNNYEERFVKDWERCLEEAKEAKKEDWSICDIEDKMGALGWDLNEVDVVGVEY